MPHQEKYGALTALPENLMTVDVDLDDDDGRLKRQTVDGVSIEPQSDGSVIVNFDPSQDVVLNPILAGHKSNLAEYIESNVLDLIGERMVEDYEIDLASRGGWDKRMAKGIKLMGVVEDETPGPFQGASRVLHPMMGEAVVQFGARAIAEMWPAGGPVKQKVIGKKSEEKVAQADRAAGYMNYQYTEEMPEAFWELDKLLFRLPLDGSAFKKCYPDPRLGRLTSRFVSSADFVVNESATDLDTAIRYTHKMDVYRNDLLKDIQSGFYRKVTLEEPLEEDETDTDDMIDDAEGKVRVEGAQDSRNATHTVLEMHVDWDLSGFNDRDPETKQPTGIALPYIMAIEKDTRKILSIKRNWKENDPLKKKRVYFKHYKYLPGLGFYGFGLLHMIGGLAKAATGALRALLDSAQFANMQGGFKSKDAKTSSGQKVIPPGTWEDTDMTSEELSKAFFPIPYQEPSLVLFNLLGFLVDAGQRFANTTEAMVGDADNTGPVGTTVALIEQGSKVFSSIHKRLHKAQGEEFRLMAELNYEVIPEGVQYPYEVEGQELFVLRADFDGRVDVIPVSDPNIFSQTQRIAQAQALLQTAELKPDLYDERMVHKRVLTALQIPDIDEVMPDKTKVIRMGAIEENMALMYGKPVRSHVTQEHQAHIMVHEQWFATLPPVGQKMLEGAFIAHQSEHYAWAHYFQMQEAIGVRLPPPPDFNEDNPDDMRQMEIPPEIESQIDLASAQAAQVLKQQQPPSEEEIEADLEQKRIDSDNQIRNKDIDSRDKRERDTSVAKINLERENKVREDKTKRAEMATGVTMDREQRAHEKVLEKTRQQGLRDQAAIKARVEQAIANADRKADMKKAADDRAAQTKKDNADRAAKSKTDAAANKAKAAEKPAEKAKK
jgi:hypothetical protein